MLKEIQDALARRKELIEFHGRKLLVVELENAADVAPEGTPKEDLFWHIMVACIYEAAETPEKPGEYEMGPPALTAADVPALKGGSRRATRPLAQAVERVNGLNAEDEAKNSAAAPA
jgi:hypothetical protein